MPPCERPTWGTRHDAADPRENVTASYGSSQALFGIDLTIAEGQAVAMMGRNGMGKSTTGQDDLPVAAGRRAAGLRRARPEPAGQPPGRAAGHRAGARGPALFPRSDGGGKPDRPPRVPGHWDLERIARLFPRLAERRGQTRLDAVGRRAADAGDRARPDDQPGAC